MGTQQILLLVLSVIIIGIALSVGIFMFHHYSLNNTITQIVASQHNLCSQAHTYWILPISMGGAGRNTDKLQNDLLIIFLGSQLEDDLAKYFVSCNSAIPSVSFGCEPFAEEVTDGKSPIITINLNTGIITADMTGNIQSSHGF